MIKGKMGLDAQTATTLTSISIAVLAITILIIILWFMLHTYVRRWRRQSDDHSRRARSRLEEIKQDVEGILKEAHDYSHSDAEPYGPIVQELYQTLTSVRQTYPGLVARSNNLGADTLAYPGSVVRRFLLGFWREPRYWQQRAGDYAALALSIQELSTRVAEAGSSVERLREMPAQAARQVEELKQATATSLRIARELRAQGIHGDRLDAAAAAVEELHARLSTLSTHLSQDSESPSVERVGKEDVIAAWRTLKETRRPVGTYLDQLKQWQSARQDIGQGLDRALQMARTAAEGLDELPPSFDSSGLAAELKRIHGQATELQKAALSLTIQDLPDIAERVSRVTEQGSGLIHQIETVKGRFERFRQSIGADAAVLNRIESRMNQMAQFKEHPVVWGQHQAELARLRTLEASASVITAEWDLAQIDERMARASQLAHDARRLEDQVAVVLAQRDQLMGELARPELSLHVGWLSVAEDLDRQITASQLVQADWPKELAAAEVLNDARRLAQRHKQWVPMRPDEALAASQIGHRLLEIQELIADVQTFQRRLQGIASVLRSGELEAIRQAVERLIGQMKDAKPPLGSKAARHLRNLERLERRGRRFVTQIDLSSLRTMRNEARRIDSWTSSCHKCLEALPAELHAEIKEMEAELRNEVAALQNWAPFDRELAMKEAQRLLGVQRPNRPPGPVRASQHRVDQTASLVNQVDELLEARQGLYTAYGDIRSQIRERVQDRFDDLEKRRQEAQRKLKELRKLKNASESAWPPLICDTRWAEDLLNHAQRDEQKLGPSGRTTSDVDKVVNALIDSHDRVMAEVKRKEDRLREERQDLENLLDQIERWRQQLRAYRGFRYQDRAVTEAITARLSEIDAAMRDEKRHHSTPLTHAEARQVLQRLWAFAHERDVPLEGGQVIRVRDIEAG